MTYWMLNAVFLAVVAAVVVAVLLERRSPRWTSVAVVLVVVLLMTALFDNIMIGVGLVGYDESRISGALVGIAPLEDFAYAVAAVVLLPTLWALLAKRPSAVERAESAGPGGTDA
ncbi:lycopene cyclase domain-containing protein [Glaciihabitans arcticus]|uniref:Lycopene cyclase domain-containing protein n=1 Tax=Glaciihabitans arcticus TaxID=2668039 RepID=A0A4Q9GXW6_9MICO|nr:lycopene cyclase domain-containing protein [Glaciihabitans arcticus]TBN58097.1 lycopene cyclase domain-containing protein [Glaciihabitans arcticus]